MPLRQDLLRIASELPKGDPTRREILAALSSKEAAWEEMTEGQKENQWDIIGEYERMAKDFVQKFRIKLVDASLSGSLFRASFRHDGTERFDAQKLAHWLKTYNVLWFGPGGRTVDLYWKID